MIRPRRRRRRGEPTARQKRELRLAVYGRAGGCCELRMDAQCLTGPLPFDGEDEYRRGHLVHLGARRRHGWSMENCVWGCWRCHLIALHNPKPCPPKRGGEGPIDGDR